MKRLLPLLLSVATSFPIFAPSKVEANSPSNSNLPVQITEFYNQRNLLSSFSSEAERELVIDSLVCTGALRSRHLDISLDFCDRLPKQPKSERLTKIRTLIASLERQMLRDFGDSAMVIPGYLPGSGPLMRRTDPNVVPLPSSADSLPPQVFKIENQVRHTENAITVQVLAYQVEPAIQARLISQYEKQGNDENLMQVVAAHSTPTQEYHQWMLINNKWMKLEQEAILTDISL